MDNELGRRKKGRLVNETGLLTHRYSKPFFRRYWDIDGLDEKTRGELDRIGRIIAQKCLQTMRNGGLRQYHMKKWIGPLMTWMSVDVYDNGLGAPLVTVEVKSKRGKKEEEMKVPGLFLIQGQYVLEANPSVHPDGVFMKSYADWRLYKKPFYIKDGTYFNGFAATKEDNDNETRTVAMAMIDTDGKYWVCGYGAQQIEDVSSLNTDGEAVVRWGYADGELLGFTALANDYNFGVQSVLYDSATGWAPVSKSAESSFSMNNATWSEYDKYCSEFWSGTYSAVVKEIHAVSGSEWSATTVNAIGLTTEEVEIDPTWADLTLDNGVNTPTSWASAHYDNATCGAFDVYAYGTCESWEYSDFSGTTYEKDTAHTTYQSPCLLSRSLQSYFSYDFNEEEIHSFNLQQTAHAAVATWTDTGSAYWLTCGLWVWADVTETVDPHHTQFTDTYTKEVDNTTIYGSTECLRHLEHTKSVGGCEVDRSLSLAYTKDYAADASPNIVVVSPAIGEDTTIPLSITYAARSVDKAAYLIPINGIELVGIYLENPMVPEGNIIRDCDNPVPVSIAFYADVQWTFAEEGPRGFEFYLNGHLIPANWYGEITFDYTGTKEPLPVAVLCSNLTADGTFVFMTTVVNTRGEVVRIVNENYTQLWGYSSLDDSITNLSEMFDDIPTLKDELQKEYLATHFENADDWDGISAKHEYKTRMPAMRGLARVAVPLTTPQKRY